MSNLKKCYKTTIRGSINHAPIYCILNEIRPTEEEINGIIPCYQKTLDEIGLKVFNLRLPNIEIVVEDVYIM